MLARAFRAHPRVALFLGALALRWTYALALYAWLGDAGLMGPDSAMFLTDSRALAAAIAEGKVRGWEWLGRDLSRMPLFVWIITLCSLVAGPFDALAYVLVQGLFDAGTCLVVYALARRLDTGIAAAAAVAFAITPTALVVSGLAYTDTIFVFFFALSLLGAASWLKAPGWGSALLTGGALGAAALVRAVAVGWAAALIVLLLAAVLLRRKAVRAPLMQLVAAAALFGLLLSPVLARNHARYGTLAITAQTGPYWAYWIVPLVKEAKDGTPWSVTAAEVAKRLEARYGAELRGDPFRASARQSEFARAELAALGLAAIAKAWLYGAAINLGSPAVIIVPPVAKLPRTGFYDTPGATKLDKILNFLFRSDNPLYAWLLLLGALGVLAWRVVEIAGLASLAFRRETFLVTLLLFLAAGYVLGISGPIASPKYRLPIEPILAVWAGAGYAFLSRRCRRRAAP
jgi:4-amino-4-deoxy-L-arabinose transferase-like glycosyltransferase